MANLGRYPVDLASPIGMVRLELGDTDPTGISTDESGEGQGHFIWYSDAELTAMLVMYSNDPRRLAIRLLRQIAVSQSLLLKKFSSQQLSVDGPAITTAMLKAAKDIEDALAVQNSVEAVDFAKVVPTGGHTHIPDPLRPFRGHEWL